MRRPTRTRRLSIAAVLSFAAFVVTATAGVRSFWTMDEFDFGQDRAIALNGGCLHYARASFKFRQDRIGHLTWRYQVIAYPNNFLGFATWKGIVRFSKGTGTGKVFHLRLPLWPISLLLLIAPACWLIARPANPPAFPLAFAKD
ncbi:MAG TPA: hypothetical protein VFW23_11280 [Tepidisphaeraceae bacterium]|nr:hypothetical protein [Tepidisphaeraceae bacterium]